MQHVLNNFRKFPRQVMPNIFQSRTQKLFPSQHFLFLDFSPDIKGDHLLSEDDDKFIYSSTTPESKHMQFT